MQLFLFIQHCDAQSACKDLFKSTKYQVSNLVTSSPTNKLILEALLELNNLIEPLFQNKSLRENPHDLKSELEEALLNYFTKINSTHPVHPMLKSLIDTSFQNDWPGNSTIFAFRSAQLQLLNNLVAQFKSKNDPDSKQLTATTLKMIQTFSPKIANSDFRIKANYNSIEMLKGLIQRASKWTKQIEKLVSLYTEKSRITSPRELINQEENFGLPSLNSDGYNYHGTKIWTREGDLLLSGSGIKYTYIQFSQSVPQSAKYKIYLTLNPIDVANILPSLVSNSKSAGAVALKVKFTSEIAKERDRIILYFSKFENAIQYAKLLNQRFAENEIYGDDLPFTLQVGEKNSPVYVAVDPFVGLTKTSWRGKITNTIAKALEESQGMDSVDQRAEMIRDAIKREGIDPDFWLPFEYAQIYENFSGL